LLKDCNVRFAGYRKPHPLENMVEIKVQTDGTKTPAMAIIDVCERTMDHVTAMENSLKHALELYKSDKQPLYVQQY